jgi:polysaccharide export outer membrane protein
MSSIIKRVGNLTILSTLALSAFAFAAFAQGGAQSSRLNETRPRVVAEKDGPASSDARPVGGPESASAADEMAIQSQINSVYQSFYHSYRLGPGDIIGIYVDKHPEDSVPRVVVSPVGQVYYPLLGNVSVVGKTMEQITSYFTTAVSEFIKDPRVTIALLEAQSNKIGVLGDVRVPGVQIMTRPMRVLDAITQAGGVTETGKSSDVSVLRQFEDGRVQVLKVNVKKILQGKASPEENAYLRTGDTIIVHGNLYKAIGKFSSVIGLTSFVSFLARGGR